MNELSSCDKGHKNKERKQITTADSALTKTIVL